MSTTTAPVGEVDIQGEDEGWLKLARGATTAMVAWAIVLQLTAGTLIPPVAFIGAAYLILLPFLRRERRRTGLVLAAFSVTAVAGNLPGVADELAHPESAPAFILTLLATLSAAVAAVSGLGMFRTWSSRPAPRVAAVAGSLFVAGIVLSLVAASTTVSEVASADDVAVVAEGVAWAPSEVVVDDESSGVWVDNRDGIRHTFTVPALGIDLDVPALKSRRVDIDAPAGSYQIICEVPGHDSMTATLIVEG